MQKTVWFYHFIRCEVEFGVWKLIQVDFTWLFRPFLWLMWSDVPQRRLPGNSIAALICRKEPF